LRFLYVKLFFTFYFLFYTKFEALPTKIDI
jgi:hypothetical protein